MAGNDDANGAPVYDANWPDAAPHPDTEVIITIVCGNSNYHWAIHEGRKQDFYPSLFWRTSTVPEDDLSKAPCQVIQRYLPPSAQETFFGTAHGTMTSQVAYRQSAAKRIPIIPVYIVSSNPKHEAGILFLLRDMPVHIYRMQGSHFFSLEQGAHPDMGVDRLAAAKAAIGLTGVPALVIDGGTSMSYTAVSVDGKIEGGGISPGLQVKLCSLREYTGALPSLTHVDVSKAIEKCKRANKPLPLFAQSTEKAILGSVLSETAQHVSGIVKGWIAHAKPQLETANPNEGGPKLNTQFTVIVSGGDGNTIKQLLDEKHSNIVEQVHAPPKGFSVLFQQHMVHLGIQRIFCDHLVLPENKVPEEQLRDSILGQRVAKNFQKQRGGSSLYRGSVASVDRGKPSLDKDTYTVLYDDGEREAVGVAELYDMLLVYASKGENWSPRDSYKKKRLESKADEAKQAAWKLAEKSSKVRKIVSQRNVEKQQKTLQPAAPAVPSSGSKRPTPDPNTAPAPNKKSKLTATAAAPTAAAQPKPSAAVTPSATTESEAGNPIHQKALPQAVGASSDTGNKRPPSDKKLDVQLADETSVNAAPNPAAAVAEKQIAISAGKKAEKPIQQKPQQQAVASSATPKPSAAAQKKTTPSAQKTVDKPKQQKSKPPAPAEKPAFAPSKKKIPDPESDPLSVVGLRMCKLFQDGNIYFGRVTEFVPADETEEKLDMWNVTYDDGDVEDYYLEQIKAYLALYNQQPKKDRRKP